MEEGAGTASPLWNWDYLDRCFAHRRVCISFGLWICSACCWIAAHALTLYLRCTKKCGQDQSTLCATFCLLTSLCDTVGAILARQLTIQVFTGAYLAVVDFVNFVSILFPVCGSKSKSKSGRGSRERRRRHLRASVFALALPLCLGPGWAIWAAVPKASVPVRGPQRKLLGSLLQENLEVFGYLLGGIAAIGSWASRIPPFSKICRGKPFSYIHLWTRFLSALAGLLYASAIVAHDRQPEYLLQATPWFLISLGRASLDLAIIFLSCVVKSKMRQAFGFAAKAREGPDTQALLTCTEKEDSQEARTEDQNSDWVPLTSLSHCKPLRTMTAVSRYMELTVEPVQQAGCSATRLPGDGQTSTGDASLQEPPSYPPIQVIQARVSSGSSSEVSSINSDLEWDPEDVNLERNKNNVESLRSQMHKGSLSPVDLTSDN
ncbi:transmembrane protein 44 isoform X3 [Cricetulus griseus]|uniref:Transmembrane protein 44 n=1 Tax=Cricetulus griseus TaxID=10029 RepID=A0A8C2QGG8_CRIGR|nr:transmembrane protein 44 isoform X3 [Cricetulus griseus]XP_027268698.1 transmembrane protein 44 isoform X3 [Cricetulus griseus]